MNFDRRFTIRRRTLLRGLLSVGAFGATSQIWNGCAKPPTDSTEPSSSDAAAVKALTFGFVYVGPKDDYGYNQSHAQAVAAMKAKFPDFTVVEEASIPETAAAKESMRNMIELDKASIIFPTSWGYFDPYCLELAKEFPEVQFFHPNHPLDDTHPPNFGSYFSSLVEPAYLNGVIAGLTTKTGHLGYVIPKTLPVVLKEANSFALGARSVNPEVIIHTVITGDWALPVKEAEATNSLVDQNVDVVITRVDNPKVVITTAAQRGAYSCGYHVDQKDIAPDMFLSGVEWHWETIYTYYADLLKSGKTLMDGGIPRTVHGGLKEGFSRVSDYGEAVSPEAKAAADEAKQKLIAGELAIFQGELKDNKGNVIIPAGESWSLDDPRLNETDWLVEGVVGG